MSSQEPKIFALPPRVDSSTAAAFEAGVMAMLGTGLPRLILEFGATSYMSSAGLRVVLLAAKKAKASGGLLVLASVAPPIMEVFRVSGFVKILDFAPDVAAAREKFGLSGSELVMDMKVPGIVEELSKIASGVESFLQSHNVASEITFQVNLCLDELMTNAIQHGSPNGRQLTIGVRLAVEGGEVVEIRMTDDGLEFNPLTAPEPDLESSVEERPIGGLGVHFVRTFIDEVAYVREGTHNVVTLRKRTSTTAQA